MKRALLLALTVFLFGGAAAAESEPPTYFVVGPLAPGDTLSVRAGPAGNAERLDGLPPGTGPIEVLSVRRTGQTDWAEIVWRGDPNAWVAFRFLRPTTLPRLGRSAAPVGLACFGTEPFWDVRLVSEQSYTFSSPETYDPVSNEIIRIPHQIASIQTAQNRVGWPVAIIGTDGATLTIQPSRCSDGMSDADYPWSVTYLTSGADGERALMQGCCALPLGR